MGNNLKETIKAILKKEYPEMEPIFYTMVDGHPILAASEDKKDPWKTQHFAVDLERKTLVSFSAISMINELMEAVEKLRVEY